MTALSTGGEGGAAARPVPACGAEDAAPAPPPCGRSHHRHDGPTGAPGSPSKATTAQTSPNAVAALFAAAKAAFEGGRTPSEADLASLIALTGEFCGVFLFFFEWGGPVLSMPGCGGGSGL